MPYINVKLTPEVLTTDKKMEIIAKMTQVLVEALNKNPETTIVIIDEIETDNWGISGKTVTERRQIQNKTQS